ncbi:hypothetical protein FACS1894200_06830 [Spirochaetia bacterium]|nr:hypothetical protein FACS1894200_06830 [Spirochaetia bacterium]
MNTKILVGALKACETEEQVEDTFGKFEVANLSEKIQALNESMGSPEMFFCGGDTDKEAEYSTTLSMFLTGEWKLNYFYDKMGF